MIQVGIAVCASVLLVLYDIRPLSRSARRDRRQSALATALMEFHKQQCYFVCSVQIASLVFLPKFVIHEEFFADKYLRMCIVLLALTGCINVVFTLVVLSNYCRLSWYVLIMSGVAMAISIRTLVKASEWYDLVVRDEISNIALYSITELFCNNLDTKINTLDGNLLDLRIAQIICANCAVFYAWCTLSYTVRYLGENGGEKLQKKVQGWQSRVLSRTKSLKAWTRFAIVSLVAVSWTLCFSYVLIGYIRFWKSGFVSNNWSFGQIIAIAIWIPAIVEFLYIERRKFGSPACR